MFDYFAAGWNRDGLALRGMGELMKSAPADRHLLILLTDASPDDSRKILPSGKIPLSGTTTGRPAWTIRRRRFAPYGSRVSEWQQCSWGKTPPFLRPMPFTAGIWPGIRRMDQLAAAAGRLIQDEIRELSG